MATSIFEPIKRHANKKIRQGSISFHSFLLHSSFKERREEDKREQKSESIETNAHLHLRYAG